jgi:cytochrome c-type biogenesis protein
MLMEHMGILSKAAGAVIIVLGLHLTGVLKIKWLNYEKKFRPEGGAPGLIKALVIGLAFGFGWSPCVGPVLAGILALAASQKTILRGMALLAAYSAGLGIPFVLTGIAIGFFMKFFERYRRFIRAGEIAAGVLLIAIGALIFSGGLSALLRFVPPVFYEFSK